MVNELKTDVKILPIKAILKALEINKEKLLSYQDKADIKPDKIKGKSYYSLDDLGKFRQVITK